LLVPCNECAALAIIKNKSLMMFDSVRHEKLRMYATRGSGLRQT